MVGKKKRSTSTKTISPMNSNNHLIDNQATKDTVINGYDRGHRLHRGSSRGNNRHSAGGGGGGGGSNALTDVENNTSAYVYRRRNKQHYNHCVNNNLKNNTEIANDRPHEHMNGTCKHRSGSQDAESASASSVISGADLEEDGNYSESGIDYEPDDPPLIERRDNCAARDVVFPAKSNVRTVGTQTNHTGGNMDFILGMCKLKSWQRVEAIAEVLTCLSANEQRYLGGCVEAAIRANSSCFRQYEIRYNDPKFINNFVQSATYAKLLDVVFPMLSLLHSTNRQAAVAYKKLLDRLCAEFQINAACLDANEKESILDTLHLAVSAALYHPAFSIEHKIWLDMVRTTLEEVTCCPSNSNTSSLPQGVTSSHTRDEDIPVVIAKLEVLPQSKENQKDEYSIEIEWSDGLTTYLVKTADQISELHSRLLDTFPKESGGQAGGSRLLPYLNRSQKGSIDSYIRALSDLPARILVCRPIREFFYASRLSSTCLSSPPQSILLPTTNGNSDELKEYQVVVPMVSTPSTTCVTSLCRSVGIVPTVSTILTRSNVCHPMATVPNIPPPLARATPLLPYNHALLTAGISYPPVLALPQNPDGLLSCCNCAGPHSFGYCPQTSMMQVIASGDYKIDVGCPPVTTAPSSDMSRSMITVSGTNNASPPPKNCTTPSSPLHTR